MKYLLYPQLGRKTAQELAEAFGNLPVSELESRANTVHDRATYAATGGARVHRRQLEELAAAVRRLRDESPSRVQFDAKLARELHGQMHLSRAEASSEGTWAFLGCVLLPDIVRWRFASSDPTPPERFLGAARGIRNALGRCWWRGELLSDPSPPPGRDPYWLLDELVEDELTGILERQKAVASRRTAVALARGLVEVDTRGVPRMVVARDAFKRYLRLGYFVAFDALDDDELRIACESLYRKSVLWLEDMSTKD